MSTMLDISTPKIVVYAKSHSPSMVSLMCRPITCVDTAGRGETAGTVEWWWWLRQRWRQQKTAVAVDDNPNGSGQWWRMTTAHKIRRQTTTGKVKSGRQTTLALGIKRRSWCCFWQGSYIFIVVSTICCFWWGVNDFFACGVLLTKEDVVYMTLCTTYVETKWPKHPQHHIFLGGCFSSFVWMYAFLRGSTTLVIFSKQHGNVCVLYYPVYKQVSREVE